MREAVVVVVAAVDLALRWSRVSAARPSACGRIRRPSMTSVSSSMPRCLRSLISAAIGWSHSPAELLVVDFEVVVVVPRLAGAVPDLHEAHAAFDQPPGDQQLPGVRALAVHVADVLRLAVDVERVGRFVLHAVGEFEAMDPRLELRVARARFLVDAGSVFAARSSCAR